MKKVIMKHIPKSFDNKTRYSIMKNWASVIVDTHSPSRVINIVSAKEVSKVMKNDTVVSKTK